MPRQGRIVVAGELFHVTQRGNYKQRIFEDDIDRTYYLKLFEGYKNKYGLELFAFCLMDNHVHFIVRPQQINSLAQTICRTHQRYAYYFHKKKEIRGHLWQERFYSCLLYGQHILHALRYVERNPVRANIVSQPWDYSWSSTRAHLGTKYNIITLSDPMCFIEHPTWKEFISEAENELSIQRLRQKTFGDSVLGSQEDIARLEQTLGRRITPAPKGKRAKPKPL